MTNTQPDQMKRGEFLRSLGLSSAALMSVYCLGTLTSCSSDSDDPAPTPPAAGFTGNADTSKGAIDFTLDLTAAAYSKLKTVGEFVAVDSVVVANAGGNMVAVGRVCTHQAGRLTYRSTTNDFICDNHGGLFNTNGSVKASPPTTPVPSYKTSLTNSGNTLRVTA
ncbi:QcrA and Rieske domain-containing protein [Tellurirhabdus rosea]|uniref:QcrA and Rieske domain-containing protein n=1 Tax=Tellurirhabdus rosea TaxID=2674997 RepID=UPI00225C13BA|nr:Rieske 2Fe-2S domain-containing protein [Tellurirhabdus rosea]